MVDLTMVIRRRTGLMGFVAVIATVFSGAYVWSFSETQSGVPLLIGAVLGVIAVFHGFAWRDARTPLLVADETGLRVRLGSAWTGIPWQGVERIEIDERGRLADGHVAVLPRDEGAALADAGVRSRLGAALNRWLYDASLVVPFGLTTSVSVADVTATLTRLADGRTEIVRLDVEAPEPTPTVELTSSGDDEADDPAAVPDPDDWRAAPAPTSVGDRHDEEVEAVTVPDEPAPIEEPRGADLAPAAVTASWSYDEAADEPFHEELLEALHDEADEDADERPGSGDPDDTEDTVPAPGTPEPSYGDRSDVAARDAQPHRRFSVSTLRSRPARREEVTMPVRREPATLGMLALSEPAEEQAEPLPEVTHLRRRDHDEHDGPPEGGRGNVSLIIDATTDLTAKAMSRVRRPLAAAMTPPSEQPGTLQDEAGEETADLVIGAELAQARRYLGLSVDDLAERTRIRPFVIESLEVDDFSPCGGDFYARGHLRMLARVLGIDAAPLLAAYDERFATSPVSPKEVFDAERAASAQGMVKTAVGGPNWGALIATVLVLLLVWGVARFVTSDPGGAADQARPDQNAAGLGSPGVGNPPVAEAEVAHVKVSAIGGDSRVVVRDADGKPVFEGMVRDGQARKLEGDGPLRVLAADGGVISLSVKGRDLGFMGESGERSRERIAAKPPKRDGGPQPR